MASWKDDLRPASFRGINFKIDSHQYTGGRRVTFHEFPDRDIPYAEDLGKVGETFKVQGYLIGDNIAEQKKKLIKAVNQRGPGELVHPYLGTKQVQCGAFSIDENKNDGRIVQVSFQFYEAGDNRFPNTLEDKQLVLENKVANGLLAAKNLFDKGFSIENLPGFVVDTARASVNQVATAFENATKGLAKKADEISALAFNIRNLRAEVDDLIKAPAQLSQRLQDSFGLLQNALGSDTDSLKAFQALQNFQTITSVSPFITPSRIAEASNKKVFDSFIKQTATLNAVQVGAAVSFTSTEEAVSARENLVESLETQVQETEDDTVFQTFTEVKAQLVKAVPDSEAELPNVQSYTPPGTVPALVLAYDLFENQESEQDLIDRNKISHPGFVLGGKELEVLNVRTRS